MKQTYLSQLEVDGCSPLRALVDGCSSSQGKVRARLARFSMMVPTGCMFCGESLKTSAFSASAPPAASSASSWLSLRLYSLIEALETPSDGPSDDIFKHKIRRISRHGFFAFNPARKRKSKILLALHLKWTLKTASLYYIY